MEKFAPKLVLVTCFTLLFSIVSEPLLSNANSKQYDSFEKDFFSDETELENIAFDELENLSDDDLEKLGVYTGNDSEDFNEEILNDDFDFEAAVESLDISKMDSEEKEKFMNVLDEAVAISGTEEVELLEEAMIGLFDSNSENFNDLEATQAQLEESYQQKIELEQTTLSKLSGSLFDTSEVYAAKKKGKIAVGVNVAAVAFNMAIGGVVGGGVSAVKSYIKKKGKKKAVDGLSRVATAQAKKLKIKKIRGVAIATVMHGAIQFALDYSDVGSGVSRFIDSKDWYKKNGWIDITK